MNVPAFPGAGWGAVQLPCGLVILLPVGKDASRRLSEPPKLVQSLTLLCTVSFVLTGMSASKPLFISKQIEG